MPLNSATLIRVKELKSSSVKKKWFLGYSAEILGSSGLTTGEGNGTPLQYSCLENPMDTGAWWASVHGVAKSQTRLHFHFSLSCIGEGNGNPLQCSCLENPRDGGAWWSSVYGVAQSWTRLKQLSSSSSSSSSNYPDWQPTPVFLPGESQGQGSLVGCRL